MKILGLNQFNEKQKANHISLSDLADIKIDIDYYDFINDKLKYLEEKPWTYNKGIALLNLSYEVNENYNNDIRLCVSCNDESEKCVFQIKNNAIKWPDSQYSLTTKQTNDLFKMGLEYNGDGEFILYDIDEDFLDWISTEVECPDYALSAMVSANRSFAEYILTDITEINKNTMNRITNECEIIIQNIINTIVNKINKIFNK